MASAEVNAIAAAIDARSGYFNWTNDVTGLRQALNPARPMTKRKRLVRQYAALLANVSAGERNAYDGGNEIGLDVDTQVDIGTLSTIFVACPLLLWLGERWSLAARVRAAA